MKWEAGSSRNVIRAEINKPPDKVKTSKQTKKLIVGEVTNLWPWDHIKLKGFGIHMWSL